MKPVRDVLYLVSKAALPATKRTMSSLGGELSTGPRVGEWMVVHTDSKTVRFLLVDQIETALKLLADHYFNFVVVDTCSGHAADTPESGESDDDSDNSFDVARSFLERLHYAADPDQRYPLSRIIAVLPADDSVARRAFALGKLRLGGFVIELSAGLFELMDQLYDPDPGKPLCVFLAVV